jgi:hypothetical protein
MNRPFTGGEIADGRQRAKRKQNSYSALHCSLSALLENLAMHFPDSQSQRRDSKARWGGFKRLIAVQRRTRWLPISRQAGYGRRLWAGKARILHLQRGS